ncbi:hypothetical protein CRI83_11970 [Liquorilactobacillus nagelii]|jgi:hypothetical protein|uniref:IS110 family transposase n=1 Tax=Liquorilactobacillus nagelii TaxID=82688 RepID=A0A3Q8CEE0_9LACO|nr:hypothetical protein BSQ50_02315 [Liquorilactobacillus nagelii]MCC7617341.1 hypothetical protein [Liquorilactobacillus nagelii]
MRCPKGNLTNLKKGHGKFAQPEKLAKALQKAIRSPRKRALALIARKLVRVIYTLLSRHQIYQKEELV